MKSLIFLVLTLLGRPDVASAFPEFVRHGYFSCSSCHVSPAGGGIVTDYGRSFAAEKVSTWTKEKEELVGHGFLPATPDWLLLGGDARQIQTVVETSQARSGRWIKMQRDLDACIKVSVTFSCATTNDLGLRKGFVRADAGENFLMRAGRFFPRHGLMIANHTSPVRRGVGFEQGKESDQLELTFVSEFVEATLYKDFGRRVRLGQDDPRQNEALPEAYGATVAGFIAGTSRVGVSFRELKAEKDAEKDRTVGAFAAIGWSPRTYTLLEIDRRKKSAFSHLKLAHEPIQGLVPYLLHEADVPDVDEQTTRKDTYGGGLQWFPRPHLEVDSFYGHLLMRQTYSYAAVAYLMLHYYL